MSPVAWNGEQIRRNSLSFPVKPLTRRRRREARQERTLARFLGHHEDIEASCPDKPRMEDEWLRTGHGPCHHCQAVGPLFQYEIDPDHREFLNCGHCDQASDSQVCDVCVVGASRAGKTVYCAHEDEIENPWGCTWAQWLTDSRVPWLCGSCWRRKTDEEAAHVAELINMEA